MASILLYDERFPVNITNADLVMCVRRGDNLITCIEELSRLIQSKLLSVSPGWSHELHVCCGSDNNGLVLGTGVNHKNIAQIFASLKFKVGNVIINECSAALIYPSGNNGILMCKKLSRAVYANVTAASIVIHLTNSLPSNGSVVRWNQRGSIHSIQEFDATGKITGILYHPGLNAVVALKNACLQKNINSGKILSFKHSLMRGLRKLITGVINSFHTNHLPVSAKVIARR